MTALQLENLYKSYKGRTILRNCSLSLEEGRALCLFGPTGCGKTTLLRIVAGLTEPDSGIVRLRGRTVNDDGGSAPPSERNAGMLFQDLALWPHMRVARQIEFVLESAMSSRIDRKVRLGELLSMVGLDTRAREWPNALSRGEQQRLAFARALATRPRLLLLDEPFSSQDYEWRDRLIRCIKEFQADGTTVLFTTHQTEDARALADYVALMTPRSENEERRIDVHSNDEIEWSSFPLGKR